MNVLVLGPGDPQSHLKRLALWHGELFLMPPDTAPRDVDLVLLMPGGMDEPAARRARLAGVRFAEVCDGHS